jgi:hypothetical protein
MAGIEYIEAEEVRRRPFRVAVTPLPSLQGALVDAVGTGRKGTPMAWRRAIRAQLRPRDRETLAPFVTPGQTLVPDPLIGIADPPGESFKTAIERMIATPDDELVREVEVCREATGNEAWNEVERDPRRWLRSYVGTLLRAWKGFAPVWRRSQAALVSEVERIGVATAIDAQLELLDGILAAGRVEDGRWLIHCKFGEGRKVFPETGLVLMPLLAGDGGLIIDVADSTMRRIGYPVPSLTELGVDEDPARAYPAGARTPDQHRAARRDPPLRAERRDPPRQRARGRRPRCAGPLRPPGARAPHRPWAIAPRVVRGGRAGRALDALVTPQGRGLPRRTRTHPPLSRTGAARTRRSGRPRGR